MSTRKIWLNINGANRMLICNPEKDSLADVLRRIGLTGTKIGCNCGQCGACTVLLNGETIRSCIKKIRDVQEYSKIITIEGIGTPNHLHPIQEAWIAYGGVQCGFCSPGFIVSAYGLLTENAAPTREEVRDWFYKHHNICRCTGYKPLTDAVMAAAEVMRGEKPLASLRYKVPEDGRIYGTSFPKPTAVEKVTGLCDYGDDISLKMPDDTLYLAIVQPHADRARVLKIDYSEAEKMPGVAKVITAADIPGKNIASAAKPHPRAVCDPHLKPLFNDKEIFRYGDVVAVVAARTREEARAAAARVKVELEPLHAYMTAPEAAAPDAERVHQETPNIFCYSCIQKGQDTRDVFRDAPYVVEGSFYSSREPHLVLEPDTVQAYTDEEGRVTIHCKSQTIFANRASVAVTLGMSPEKVRIVENPTGASFGYAMCPTAYSMAAVCTVATGKPVSLTMSYAEHQAYSGKRAPSYTNARMACDKQGRIIGLEYDMAFESGAYPETSTALIDKSVRFIGNPYKVPNVRGIIKAILTNHGFGIQYRGFGSPQCYTSSEAIMDMMADKIGMDRFDFRYLNIAREGDLTVNQIPFHNYPMQEMMDIMRPYYKEAVKRAKEASTDEDRHGVGIVWGGYHSGLSSDNAEVALELNPDGSVTNYNSWEQVGQGADLGSLAHTHEALRPLGLRPDQIKLVQNDTALTPDTGPAAGSRSHYMAGLAIIDAAQKLMGAMRKADGSYRTYGEMVQEGIPTKYFGKSTTVGVAKALDVNTGIGKGSPAANYLLMLVEVSVNVRTGKVKVLSCKAVSDIGAIGSRQAVEGQAYGGFAHSVGFALSEDYSDGRRHATMLGAGIPTVFDIPDDMEYIFHVTPRENGPHKSAGCSEGYQSVGHAAIINAINDAVGVRIYELPAKPEKIRAALEARAKGLELKPEKYQLGQDFYATLEDAVKNPA